MAALRQTDTKGVPIGKPANMKGMHSPAMGGLHAMTGKRNVGKNKFLRPVGFAEGGPVEYDVGGGGKGQDDDPVFVLNSATDRVLASRAPAAEAPADDMDGGEGGPASAPGGGGGGGGDPLESEVLNILRQRQAALPDRKALEEKEAKVSALQEGALARMLESSKASTDGVNIPLLKASAALMGPTRTGGMGESLAAAGEAGAGALTQQRQMEAQRADREARLQESIAKVQSDALERQRKTYETSATSVDAAMDKLLRARDSNNTKLKIAADRDATSVQTTTLRMQASMINAQIADLRARYVADVGAKARLDVGQLQRGGFDGRTQAMRDIAAGHDTVSTTNTETRVSAQERMAAEREVNKWNIAANQAQAAYDRAVLNKGSDMLIAQRKAQLEQSRLQQNLAQKNLDRATRVVVGINGKSDAPAGPGLAMDAAEALAARMPGGAAPLPFSFNFNPPGGAPAATPPSQAAAPAPAPAPVTPAPAPAPAALAPAPQSEYIDEDTMQRIESGAVPPPSVPTPSPVQAPPAAAEPAPAPVKPSPQAEAVLKVLNQPPSVMLPVQDRQERTGWAKRASEDVLAGEGAIQFDHQINAMRDALTKYNASGRGNAAKTVLTQALGGVFGFETANMKEGELFSKIAKEMQLSRGRSFSKGNTSNMIERLAGGTMPDLNVNTFAGNMKILDYLQEVNSAQRAISDAAVNWSTKYNRLANKDNYLEVRDKAMKEWEAKFEKKHKVSLADPNLGKVFSSPDGSGVSITFGPLNDASSGAAPPAPADGVPAYKVVDGKLVKQ